MRLRLYTHMPLALYLGFAAWTVASLLLGPVQYQGLDYWVLLPFLLIYLVLFVPGYEFGARGAYPGGIDQTRDAGVAARRRVWLLLRLLLTWGLCSSLVRWVVFVRSGATLSLETMGDAYVEGYDGYVRGAAAVDFWYVMVIVDHALVTLCLLFGFSYFCFIGRSGKLVVLAVALTYLLLNVVGGGKQKYLGDVAVFTAYSLLAHAGSTKKKIRPAYVLGAAVVAVLVAGVFVELLRQRYEALGVDLSNVGLKMHPLMHWDRGAFLFDVLGDEYGFAAGVFLVYFSNGLYGLYLGLTLPFEWSLMAGNSYSLGRIVEILAGQPGLILERTYPYRVGEVYGWEFDKWHSAFAWLASDLSFVGVLALTPLFAFCYGRLWRQSLDWSNASARPLFVYLSLGLVFSFANNQLVHGLAGVLVLAFLSVSWLAHQSRGRLR